ncbi:MAG: hypothetical protein VKN33_03460 [Candidatus Sericytochromatia bacterium]|nr:hypothetical protein [Candidatus Sericytochromatia bacterium]
MSRKPGKGLFKHRAGRLTALAAAAWVTLGGIASAVPVQVKVLSPLGPVGAGVPVVLFSYDVEKIFPGVEAHFARSRPVPPAPRANFRPLVPLQPVKSFFLVQATELEKFRDNFAAAHRDDNSVIRELMPEFDAVYKKFGDSPSDFTRGLINTEDGRQIWCQQITTNLNTIINNYNARNGVGEAAARTFKRRYAKWLGKRNEALLYVANEAGGNPNLNFVESVAGEGGVAAFDIPPGMWFIAAQNDGFSWYRPMRVTNTGGRVTLQATDASRRRLPLAEWVGM